MMSVRRAQKVHSDDVFYPHMGSILMGSAAREIFFSQSEALRRSGW